MSGEEIINHRKNKFLKIGRSKGFDNNPESLNAIKLPITKFQELINSKKNTIIVSFLIAIVAIFLALLL